jgi:hypothetical protein
MQQQQGSSSLQGVLFLQHPLPLLLPLLGLRLVSFLVSIAPLLLLVVLLQLLLLLDHLLLRQANKERQVQQLHHLQQRQKHGQQQLQQRGRMRLLHLQQVLGVAGRL